MSLLSLNEVGGRCRKWAEQLGLLRGWRRNAAAFGFGIMATLTLAPFFAFPLLIVSFTGLIWLMNGAPSRKRIFLDGWWWGWGFVISGIYWCDLAALMDLPRLWWLVPGFLFGLTWYFAVYVACACQLTSWLCPPGLGRLCVFSAVWAGMEYMRGALIADFPWNLIGYSFGFSDAALQLGSVIGIYGLTGFAAFLGSSFAALGDRRIPAKHAIAYVIVAWTMFAVSIGFGGWRLHESNRIPESDRYVEGVTLRLVQPNIGEGRKMKPDPNHTIWREQMALTRSAGLENVTHIIWPESAIPYLLQLEKALPPDMFDGIPQGKLLIAGTARVEMDHPHLFNSLVAISQTRGPKITAFYDQGQLLPWAEYVPWRWLIPKALLSPIVSREEITPGGMRMDYSPGTGPRTLSQAGLPPFAPLICYEVVFPERASVPEHPPQWLLVITNNAWFGQSTGPYQHFEMARLRAIEQGLPMMIAGNVGISASIDPYGRVLASLGLGKKGILDVKLPKPIPGGTIYGRHGEWFLVVLLSGTAILMAWRCLRPIKSKSSPPYSW